MMHPLKVLLGIGLAAGLVSVPSLAGAQSSKSDKSESASAAKKTPAASDDFEENRRAHMQKSRENNTKKGEN